MTTDDDRLKYLNKLIAEGVGDAPPGAPPECVKAKHRIRRYGYARNGAPKFYCRDCDRFITSKLAPPGSRLEAEERKLAVQFKTLKNCYLSGESIRSAARIVGTTRPIAKRAYETFEKSFGIRKCGCGRVLTHRGRCLLRRNI